MTCFPVTNVPRDRPEGHEPPLDFPERVAYDVREVITHSGLRLIRRFFRRTHRMACLAKQGDVPVARRAKPSDMAIDTHRHTKELFRGVPMDFSCFPFRTLQPSRWPDRPPSGDLRTRQIRREFRSHPSYPDVGLRGRLSHGNPRATTRADVTFFPPHAPRMVRVMAINCKARGVEARRKLPRYLPMTGRYLSPGDMIWHLVTVADPVPESAAATTPLFRDPLTNGMISTSQMREDVRSVMTAAGRDGSKYGAHSCRIGGGTAMDFEHAPPETIKAAGAWSSEAYLSPTSAPVGRTSLAPPRRFAARTSTISPPILSTSTPISTKVI